MTGPAASANILEFVEASYRYPGGKDVVSQLSFTLRRGEMLFLTGPSGAGKSTVLRLAARQVRTTQGRVLMNGRNLADIRPWRIPAYRRELGLIFQDFQLLHDRSVFDNVALPMVIRGMTHAEAGRRVRAALDLVGLLNREKHLPRTLSGGEQQRVGIARAIVAKPALILADEPTGNLDPRMALEVMELFERFNETGVSLLIASHAIDLIEGLGHRLIHLDGGRTSDARPDAASRLLQMPSA